MKTTLFKVLMASTSRLAPISVVWLFTCSISIIAADVADSIYLGGDILTMAGNEPAYVEALAVKDGKILVMGSKAGVLQTKGDTTRVVNLDGKTLLPGFIDTHGHMILFGKNLMDANLFGTAEIGDLLAKMKAHAPNVPPGQWIVGMGYSARVLKEGRTPTIEELDTVSADRPVMIVDGSGHLASGNSALFKVTGITSETPDPNGGNFSRKADGKSLLGPMEETALNAVRIQRPAFTGELADKVVLGAVALWAKHGQTTAQEGGLGLGADDIALVRNAIDKKLLPIDLYIAAKDTATDDTINAAYSIASEYNKHPEGTSLKLLAERPDLDKRYINRVRLGGIKFWLDGSPDSCWMTKPFAVNPPGKRGDFMGYQQIPDAVLDAAFDKYWTTNLQINMHMLGDAAADQAIRAIEKAVKKYGMSDHRPVFIHGANIREDQLARIKAVGAIPSFLTTSLSRQGDSVARLWGPERTARANAANTFSKRGMTFTFSHDAPVSPEPSILELVDAGVNRIAPSGAVLGPDERVSPYVALQAVTAMAAYQIKEEKTKGTLEAGKLADLVILDKNPLKVGSMAIKSISVVETIKEGQTIFLKTTSATSTASTADDLGTSVATVGCDCHLRPSFATKIRPMSQTDRESLSRLAAAAASCQGSE
ncbi:MAG: amidohydrolase [Planctomycetota bacterium]|nr:amidohydrolase [Planctomycetota bacterium]